ncbi:hypothetical protein GW796_08125 [archaeon]|nr:hypothetical protein [archaeon]
MKKFIIEWLYHEFSGEMVISAQTSKEALHKMRTNYPGFIIDSFSIES